MPRTQTFSPSEFLMAWGNDRQECGNVRSAQREDPIELQHAALVEDDGVEVGRIEPGVIQAPFDRRRAETPASFLRRDRRSSWTAQTGTPSTTSAAAESW